MSVTIPAKMLAWPLFGAGMEKLGCNDQPCLVDVPQNKADELLVKIDAIGLCFSDVKLIRAGGEHPRVISKDLAADPVIPGHEAVMTVVKVGDQLKNQFKEGQRFIIQADIYVNGKGFAYGYAINGGMAQYSVLDQRVLNGDEGCYLLPLSHNMPSAVAALLEPWTCVQASYMIRNRKAPKDNGKVLIVAGDSQVYQAGELLQKAVGIEVYGLGLSVAAVASLEKELKTKINVISSVEDMSFDDIFICNLLDRAVAEKIAKAGNRNAVISFVGVYPSENWLFDVGRIHYEGFFYQGTTTSNLSAAYNKNVRSNLKAGGTCWLPGGAGAMGQMHTQLAVESPNGPSRIIISDMDDSRIANVMNLLGDAIKKRNVEFKAVNPSKMSADEFDQVLRDFAPGGFDDIVMLVPVVPVLNHAARFLGKDGLMNIFAGIPAGKEGELNVRDIVDKNQRYIGSSGSLTEHLRHTLMLAETGKLQPVTALAAIGGMKSLKQGLEAVINAAFPGKTVILPNCPDLPLTAIGKLPQLDAAIAGSLDKSGFYTVKTEEILTQKFEV